MAGLEPATSRVTIWSAADIRRGVMGRGDKGDMTRPIPSAPLDACEVGA